MTPSQALHSNVAIRSALFLLLVYRMPVQPTTGRVAVWGAHSGEFGQGFRSNSASRSD